MTDRAPRTGVSPVPPNTNAADGLWPVRYQRIIEPAVTSEAMQNPPTPSPERGRRTGRVVTAQVQGGLVNEHIRRFNIISVSNTVIVASFAPQRCVFLHLSSVGLESIGDAEDATMIVIFRATIIVVILIFLLPDQICVIYVSSVLLDPVGDAEDA